MAVVVDPKDVDKFLGFANEENLEAVPVAVVTEEPRLVLTWRDKEIVNISRAFLDTNGAHQETTVEVKFQTRRLYSHRAGRRTGRKGKMAGNTCRSERLAALRRDLWKCLTVPLEQEAFLCLTAVNTR